MNPPEKKGISNGEAPRNELFDVVAARAQQVLRSPAAVRQESKLDADDGAVRQKEHRTASLRCFDGAVTDGYCTVKNVWAGRPEDDI